MSREVKNRLWNRDHEVAYNWMPRQTAVKSKIIHPGGEPITGKFWHMADDNGEGETGNDEASAPNDSIPKPSTNSDLPLSESFTISAKKKRRLKSLRGLDRFKTEQTGRRAKRGRTSTTSFY